jgi:hypothetical protein
MAAAPGELANSADFADTPQDATPLAELKDLTHRFETVAVLMAQGEIALNDFISVCGPPFFSRNPPVASMICARAWLHTVNQPTHRDGGKGDRLAQKDWRQHVWGERAAFASGRP